MSRAIIRLLAYVTVGYYVVEVARIARDVLELDARATCAPLAAYFGADADHDWVHRRRYSAGLCTFGDSYAGSGGAAGSPHDLGEPAS